RRLRRAVEPVDDHLPAVRRHITVQQTIDEIVDDRRVRGESGLVDDPDRVDERLLVLICPGREPLGEVRAEEEGRRADPRLAPVPAVDAWWLEKLLLHLTERGPEVTR